MVVEFNDGTMLTFQSEHHWTKVNIHGSATSDLSERGIIILFPDSRENQEDERLPSDKAFARQVIRALVQLWDQEGENP